MKDFLEKWLKWLAFIKCFLAAGILSFVIIGNYCGPYVVVKQGQSVVRQDFILRVLKTHIASGGQLPMNVAELGSMECTLGGQTEKIPGILSLETSRYGFKYYPEAWNKPGRILLQSLVCGSYVVTFGDGSTAILSHWTSNADGNRQNEESFIENELSLRSYGGCWSTLPVKILFVSLLASFVITVIAGRVIKKKIIKITQETK